MRKKTKKKFFSPPRQKKVAKGFHETSERRRRINYLRRVFMRAKLKTGIKDVEDSIKEKDVAEVNEYLAKVQQKVKDMLLETRKDGRNGRNGNGGSGGGGGGGGETPPESGIFNRLIDEDKLADSILNIVNKEFHGKEECEICEIKLNIYDFFLLTHYYFKYIHILERTSQLAYCDYLNNKVFAGMHKVVTKSFNLYSKKGKYTNFVKLLEEKKDITFNSRPKLPRPKEENFLLAPFQEIGWKFQHSDYFGELRRQQKIVESFNI